MEKVQEARDRLEVVQAEMAAISEGVDVGAEIAEDQSTKFDELQAEHGRLVANLKMWSATANASASASEPMPRLSTASGPPIGAPAVGVTPNAFDLALSDIPPTGFASPPTIPATAIRRMGSLKAFTGPTGPEEAYKFGKWLQASLWGNQEAIRFCDNQGLGISAALSEGVNSAGGFFVVPEFAMQRFIDLKESYGIFRKDVGPIPMSSDTLSIPRRVGGVTAYAVGENTEITASEPSWDMVELVARKWGVLTKISSELSEDSIVSIADKVLAEFAYAFAKKEDDSGFAGDGTSAFHGIVGVINAMGAASYNSMGGGDRAFADIVVADDIEPMMAKLPAYALASPKNKWYISSVGYWAFMQRIMNALGGNARSDFEDGPGSKRQFMGWPVEIVQSLHNLTTDAAINTVIILFGDLSMGCTMGDRRMFRLKVSDDRYMEFDQTGIMATTRYDIKCHDVGTASVAGPVVGLRTGSS